MLCLAYCSHCLQGGSKDHKQGRFTRYLLKEHGKHPNYGHQKISFEQKQAKLRLFKNGPGTVFYIRLFSISNFGPHIQVVFKFRASFFLMLSSFQRLSPFLRSSSQGRFTICLLKEHGKHPNYGHQKISFEQKQAQLRLFNNGPGTVFYIRLFSISN